MGRTQSIARSRSEVVRHGETRRLHGALDALDQGQGQIIELVGEPGIGKTRLLAEMMGEAHRRGFGVFHTRCTEFEQGIPYQVFAHLLAARPITERLLRLPADDRNLIGKVVTRPQTGCAESERPAAWHRYRLSFSIRTLLGGLSEKVVLVIEDFHWADAESVELIDYLVRRPVDGPLLIMIVHRPRQASPRLRGTLAHGIELGSVTRIELGPLSLEQSARLLGMPCGEPRLAELHMASGGVPLYLSALAADGHALNGGLPSGDPPAHLSGLLLGEIAALDTRESFVAAAAAVLGEHCVMDTLIEVAEIGPGEVEKAVDALIARDVLRPANGGAGFTFRHPIMRWVVYANADLTWRLCAHRKALTALAKRGASTAEQAVHVERSIARAETPDLDILTRAAEEALLTDPERASHWLEVALQAFPEGRMEPRKRIELLLLRSRTLGLAGRLSESRDLLHQVLRAVGDDHRDLRASTVAFCAVIECLLGHFAEARALLAGELDTILTCENPPAEAATLLIEHGIIGAFDGQMPSCEQVKSAVRLARRHGDRVAEAGALVLNGLCDAFNSVPTARASLAAGSEYIDRLSDAELATRPEYLGLLGWAETLAGLFQDSQRHFARGMDIARKFGRSFMLPAMLLGLGNVHRHTGHLADARRTAVEARELAERFNAEHLSGLALALESLAMAEGTGEGVSETAVRLAEQAFFILRSRDFFWSMAGAIAVAAAAWYDGGPRRSMILLLDAGGGSDLPRIPPFQRVQALTLILAASLAVGEPLPKCADLAEEEAAGLDLPSPRAYARVARAMMLKHEGRSAEAAAAYQEAADLFSEAGMIHAQSRALLLAAHDLSRDVPRHEPRSNLVLARELARRCGADRAAEAAERLLRDLDTCTAEAAPHADLSVLTEREREIAGIAGTGLRTREIAAALSLSPRTVDVHLTRIYRKLSISSRAALARLMAESG
ncbi:AAA family ATPase [Actinomadura graeca]|uniref:AAA family ATPase n=1 Tax=Actinomadura graeca TaxID=2750812 RepID=A0ABX8QYN3_9ACTN|nr:LuxR family transcriptional regulator [Actinomadura graeca]QXJ23895.1 AAA family ATPase [Actinomadura graeca]